MCAKHIDQRMQDLIIGEGLPEKVAHTATERFNSEIFRAL